MANRVTGLSGMDTESMVKQMMAGYETKTNNLYRQRTQLTWKQEAYRSYITQMTSFQDKFMSFSNPMTNLKGSTFFSQKLFSMKTSGGDDAKGISVSNKTMTKNVEHTLKVKELAQAQKYVGSSASGGGYSKQIKSGEVNLKALQDGADASVSLKLDGKTIKASLGDMSGDLGGLDLDTDAGKAAAMEKVAEKLNSQFAAFGKGVSKDGNGDPLNKVNVRADGGQLVFETESGRSLSVASFGNGYTSAKSMNIKDVEAQTASFDINNESLSVDLYKDEVDADGNTVKEDDGVTVKRVRKSAEELANELNAQLNAKGFNGVPDENGKYTPNLIATASGDTLKFEASSQTQDYTIKETTAYAPDAEKKLTDGTEFTLNGKTTSELGVTTGASTDSTASKFVNEQFGTDMSALSITGNGKTMTFEDLEITADMTMSAMMNKINASDLGVKVTHNAVTGAFTMEAKESGVDNSFSLNAEAMAGFGFSDDPDVGKLNVKAQDALIEIDGVETTRSSNNFTIGDLDVTINKASIEETKDDPVTIKSSSNTESMVTGIKDFITNYNTLLGNLTTSYSQSRAKSGSYEYYEPLLDDEKAALSDKDVELWEEKAKQGLLYRDSSVGKVIDQMRNAMSASFDLGDGKKISLADIGISSADWRDKGILTVDEAKLTKALEERPEDVAALFNTESSQGYDKGNRGLRDKQNGIAYRIDDIMKDATKKTATGNTKTYGYFMELAGAENTAKVTENEMSRKIKEINERIYNMEQANLVREASFYSMFSNMESAMTKAQNQLSQMGLG